MNVEIRHHGRVIRGELVYPAQRRKIMPAVLMVHGRSVDRNYPPLLVQLRHALIRDGFVVLAFDLAGHGKSGGRIEDLTVTRAAEDVVAATRFLIRQHRINRFAVGAIGHSLGGLAVFLAQATMNARLKTLVLLGAVCDTVLHRHQYYPQKMIRLWRSEGQNCWYSERQQKTFCLKYNYYKDQLRYDSVRLGRHIHQPVLIVHGSSDESVSIREARNLFTELNEPKKLIVIPHARHNFERASDERIVTRAVRRWNGQFLATRTSRVVNVFIRNRGDYLILKRSNLVGYYRGHWAIVSGHAIKGSTVLEQAFHEAREETGLKRLHLKLIKIGRAIRRIDQEIGKTWIITPLLLESTTRRIRLDWEHSAYRWVNLKDFLVHQSYPGIEKQFKVLGLG